MITHTILSEQKKQSFMNRELKFKVWHKELKEMFWFDLMWGRNGRSGSGWISVVRWGEEKRYSTVSFGSDNTMDVDPAECEIMQFLGIQDKYGNDLYDDHLVKDCDGNIYRVWIEDGAMLYGGINKEWDQYLRFMDTSLVELIGSIYENPELLNTNQTSVSNTESKPK